MNDELVRAMRRPPVLQGYTYSLHEVLWARDNGRLLCVRLDTNYNCNLKCLYCYSAEQHDDKRPVIMGLERAKDVVGQCAELGVRSIVYLGGGEPTLYPHFEELMETMVSKGITPVVFTNGFLLTRERVRLLSELRATVMLKFDGYAKVQDVLTGPGSYIKITSAFELLVEHGFNKVEGGVTRMGVAPCMNKLNYAELGDILRMARRNGIYPNFERATAIGNAGSAERSICLGDEEVARLYGLFRTIDQEEFSIEWSQEYSAIPGHSCYIYLAGCHVTADLRVAFCPELPPEYSLREMTLREMLQTPLFNRVRAIETNIKGECRDCDLLMQCFGGCRSKAFYANGDYFASDPFCAVAKRQQQRRCPAKEAPAVTTQDTSMG